MAQAGTVYGQTLYGQGLYGYVVPPNFRADPFIAQSIGYGSVLVSWTQPQGTILAYRLIKNRFGNPVDQNDGQILIDSTTYPGNYFIDNAVVPGTYNYYALYVLLSFGGNVWVRSSVTGCLAITNYNSGFQIKTLIPSYFHLKGGLGSSLSDNFPSDVLDFYCLVLGWGMDYLKTQYDSYLNLNDAWKIPLDDLYNLATQLGIQIAPDVHPYTLRKAVFFNANINQFRGTPNGIGTQLSALTGWNADLQIGKNMMLSNDQSYFADPAFNPWSAYINYNIGEQVQYQNYWYQCIATGNLGNSPTGANTSNTWWSPIVGINNNTALANSATGFLSTWEILYPNAVNGLAAANSMFETLGVANPLNLTSFTYNSLQAINLSGSTGTVWLRSISRIPADVGVVANLAPDVYQSLADGIPLPFSLPANAWSAQPRYSTGTIATLNSQPFIALRASTGIIPPYLFAGTATTDWAPLSWDQRYRICVSFYVTGSSGSEVLTPFVEWYDNKGNFISRVFARNNTPGTVAFPNQFAYDSFLVNAGHSLSGRITDDGQNSWTQVKGNLTVSPFDNGCVFQTTPGQRSYATVNAGIANCQVGLTFVTSPQAGQSEGLILRYLNDTNYLRADQNTLRLLQNGAWSVLGTFSTPFSPGDRMIAKLNGSTITILRNNIQVLQVTNSFNSSGTVHGIIVENT